MKQYRDILVSVLGVTPQIVTETIYALSQQDEPVYIDELYLITTSTGKARAEEALAKGRALANLCREYNLPKIELTQASFVLITGDSGGAISDIRNADDSEALGNLITQFIRGLAGDPSLRLHCSIAGGRKTMGFYLGAALQLFGRPWDRLYHVLVTPEFESNPAFFYKPKKNRTIEGRAADGSPLRLNTRDAVIHLAELPFIRMREQLSFEGEEFRDLVALGQERIDAATFEPSLALHLANRTVTIGNKVIKMTPSQLVMYAAFLRQKTGHCAAPERLHCGTCTACFPGIYDLSDESMIKAMVDDYRRAYGGNAWRGEEMQRKLESPGAFDGARQTISKINRLIHEQAADESGAGYCVITSIRKYGSTRYGVKLDRGKIRIAES